MVAGIPTAQVHRPCLQLVRKFTPGYTLEQADDASPNMLFERRWATTVLEQARTGLETEYAAKGKADLFRDSGASTRRKRALPDMRRRPASWDCQRTRSNRSSIECGGVIAPCFARESRTPSLIRRRLMKRFATCCACSKVSRH